MKTRAEIIESIVNGAYPMPKAQLENMSNHELFMEWAENNGFAGFGYYLLQAIEGIFEVNSGVDGDEPTTRYTMLQEYLMEICEVEQSFEELDAMPNRQLLALWLELQGLEDKSADIIGAYNTIYGITLHEDKK